MREREEGSVRKRVRARTHGRVIHSVTISRKSIIKPLSWTDHNGPGELFRPGCIVLPSSFAGMELSLASGDIRGCTHAYKISSASGPARIHLWTVP